MFEEFVASFEDTGKTGKTFVRGSTFNPEKTASKCVTGDLHLSGVFDIGYNYAVYRISSITSRP